MEKHFVEFYSPGTFVAENTTKPIDSWNIEEAAHMAFTIKERYGATPYGFRFITRSRNDDELDSKISNRSKMVFLGGKIETLEDVKRRNDPSDRILISNMECNRWHRIITTTNGYKWTQPFEEGDVNIENWPQCLEGGKCRLIPNTQNLID